jgi:N6-adenosine-specific RNA methylase IME4
MEIDPLDCGCKSANTVAPPALNPSAKSWRDVLPVHPAADLLPLMSPDELRELGEDIRARGLLVPVVLYRDRNGDLSLLDGRNRLDAMECAGIEFEIKEIPLLGWRVTGGGVLNPAGETVAMVEDIDQYAFVISANIHRRHLTSEQKRDLIAKLLRATPEKSNRQIAETVKASPTTVGTVRAEMEATGDVSKLDTRRDSRGRQQPASKAAKRAPHGGDVKQICAEKAAPIAAPEKQVSAVHELAAQRPPEAVEKITERTMGRAELLKQFDAVDKMATTMTCRCPSGFYALTSKQRDEVIELAGKLGRFDVILVDFPWLYKTFSKKGMGRSAERHYDCMTIEEISAYPISAFAADDCVLLSWTTAPFLALAVDAMRSQGFTYKSGAAWDKEVAAMGFWFRGRHEHLLLGTRGSPPAPEPADRPPSVIIERRTTHSRKPDTAYQVIERMFPDRRKLELFARPPGRPGWWCIGLDTTAEAAAFRAELRRAP